MPTRRTPVLPVHVIAVASACSFAFLLARVSIVFTAIHRGAGASTVLLCGAAEGLLYGIGAGRLAGPLIARLGTRTVIRGAAGAMAVLIVAAPWTPSLTALVLLYGIFGLPLGLFWPAIHARIAERIAPAAAPRVQAVFNLSWSVADLIAYGSAGWLVQAGFAAGVGPWPAIGVAGAVAGSMSLAPLPEGRLAAPDPADLAEGVGVWPEPDRGRQTFGIVGWVGMFGAFTVYDAVRLVFPVLAVQRGLGEGYTGSLIAVAVLAQTATFAVTTVWKGWVWRRRWFHLASGMQLGALGLFMFAEHTAFYALGFAMVGATLAAMYGASLYYSFAASRRLHDAGGRHEAMVGAARVAGPLLGAAAAQLAGSSLAPFAAYGLVVCLLFTLNLVLFGRTSPADRATLRTAPESV